MVLGAHQWADYVVANEKLVALYGKGKALQWDAAEALDWSQPIVPGAPVHVEAFPLLSLPLFTRLSETTREQLTAGFMEAALSQFLHGEQGALMVASKLVTLCPDYEAKLYAATQTMDEARHVEVFARYVARCGTIQPIDSALSTFLETVLGAASWLELLIGMQIVVEGAALSSFHLYRQKTKDPLLGQLLDGVIRDEARHVGFGTLHLRDQLEAMSEDDREGIAEFAYTTVMAFSELRRNSLRGSTAVLERAGIALNDVLRDAARWLQQGNAAPQDSTRDGITDFILPTMRRMGLLTPRIIEKFAAARLPASPTSALVAQLDTLVEEGT